MTGARAGVAGWPVCHSLSPAIFGHWFARYGIDGAYGRIPVRAEEFEAFLGGIAGQGYAGVNITVPHKEAAFALVDDRSPVAQRMGSVNTVTVRPDGSLHGDSSDGEGFLRSLRAAAPQWIPAAGPAVLAGAGGAAKAIANALVLAGVPNVRVANRTLARARGLADSIPGPLTAMPLADIEEAMRDAALLVNATTMGMHGQPPLHLNIDAMPESAVVADIVYAPLETPLLAAARRAKRTAVDGLGMLLHQAAPGFEAWFGRAPEVDESLRQAVLEAA